MKSQPPVSPVAPPPARTVELSAYENNPFLVPIDGMRMLFSRAQSVAILMVVLAALGMIANILSTIAQALTEGASKDPAATPSNVAPSHETITKQIESIPPETWAIIAIVVTFLLIFLLLSWLVGVYIQSVLNYTSARVAKGKTVSLSEALRGGISRFGAYLWLQIIIITKVTLWSLLFIIPGIIMAVRYSLAGLSFYDKKLSASAAVKDSLALTKGAWLTTFASHALLNIVTLGIGSMFVETGAKIRLYGQLDSITKKGEAKPSAHILSWLTLGGIVLCIILGILLVALLVVVVMAYATK